MGGDHRLRDDGGRDPARGSDVRGDVAQCAQRALRALHCARAAAASFSGVRLRFAFHPLLGLAVYPLRLITGHPIDLLADPHTAMAAVAIVDVWQWGLLFAVVIVKLLETLPRQPLEAALLDHARTWEVYAYLALPMLRAALISLVFVKMVESLRAFDLISVMTRGGPGISTETLDMYAFSQGFIESGRISNASSMAVLMMIATTVAFTILWRRVRRWQEA